VVRVVEFEDWEQYYLQILRSFGYSSDKDAECARDLNEILSRPRLSVQELEGILMGKTVLVFGAHESVEAGIDVVKNKNIRGVRIAADGACTAMREQGLRPDLIVSDLDGNEEDLLFWNDAGIPLVVLGHGDNIERIRRIAPKLRHSMGTTQGGPFSDIYNFGGFTDGDRCVFLADHFGAFRIYLIGFDFQHPGKYSFISDVELKKKKLGWAQRLISLFQVDYI